MMAAPLVTTKFSVKKFQPQAWFSPAVGCIVPPKKIKSQIQKTVLAQRGWFSNSDICKIMGKRKDSINPVTRELANLNVLRRKTIVQDGHQMNFYKVR